MGFLFSVNLKLSTAIDPNFSDIRIIIKLFVSF